MAGQPGFFDLSERYEALSAAGDPLERLAPVVDFEVFRGPLVAAPRRSVRGKGGRPPFDPVLMFKILVLQALYSLSDEATEFQIKDRLSFQRFLGLGLDGTVPDATTVWLFRERLVKAKAIDRLFARFDAALTDRGISPWAGKSSTPRSYPRPSSAIPKPRKRRSKRAASPRHGKRSPQGCGRRITMHAGASSTPRPSEGGRRFQGGEAGRPRHPDVRLQEPYRHRPHPWPCQCRQCP